MEATLRSAVTPVLEIAYYESGPADGPAAVLLHGFPQDRSSWDDATAAASAFGGLLAIGEHAVLKRKRRGNVVLVTGADDQVMSALKRYAASAPLPTGVVANWS